MLLVHLCTLYAPSESSLNQLKCCWLCKCVRSVHLTSLCRSKSCILHFSAKFSLEFPWNPALFSRNTHPAIWCLTKLECNGMSFNLISQLANKSVPNIPPLLSTGKADHTPVLCTSVLRFKHSVAFLTGYLPGFQVYFLSFCRDKYNWPEEIYCAWTVETKLSERGTGMQIQYNYVTLTTLLELRSLYYVHTCVHS